MDNISSGPALANPETPVPPSRPSTYLRAFGSIRPLTPEPAPGTRRLRDFFPDPAPSIDAYLSAQADLADLARAESIALQEADPAWQAFMAATGLEEVV